MVQIHIDKARVCISVAWVHIAEAQVYKPMRLLGLGKLFGLHVVEVRLTAQVHVAETWFHIPETQVGLHVAEAWAHLTDDWVHLNEARYI